jgi:5-oxoprolinase (ATP-hydrolysing) subunit A
LSRTIDLNADLGEGMPWDAELLQLVTSANVSCNAHAGSPEEIEATLVEAERRGVVVGAHPSWEDREGFGRCEKSGTLREVVDLVTRQVRWLQELARPHQIAIRYLKPHGALYNQAMRSDPDSLPIAQGLSQAVESLKLPLMGLPAAYNDRLVRQFSGSYIREGFPDRRYRDDGTLVPRSEPGALIEGVEEVVEHALQLVERGGLDSLCLHGDSPEAVARAVAIRKAFDREGIVVRSFFVE